MIANCLDEFSTGDDRSSVRRRSGTHGWTRRTRILLLNRGKNIFSYRSIVSRNFENENPIRLFRNYQFKNEEDGTERLIFFEFIEDLCDSMESSL